MVRNYKRKTPPISKEKMKDAVLAVLRDKQTIRNAAEIHGVKRATLADWVKKQRAEQIAVKNVTVMSKGPKTAPERTVSIRGRENRHSKILPSSPVMEQLHKEQVASVKKKTVTAAKVQKAKEGDIIMIKNVKPAKSASRQSFPAKSASRATRASTSTNNLDQTCLVCLENFLQHEHVKICIECCRGAHVDCVRISEDVFTCINCFFELESDSEDIQIN